MKLTKKIMSAALALALAATFGTAAHAQIAYNDGDLFIGFENGTTNNYVVDLGSYTQFTAGTNLTFNLSSANLTSAFNGSWASNSAGSSNVQWGVIGGNSTSNTLFLTRGRTTAGTQSVAPKEFTSSGTSNIIQSFSSFTTDFGGETPVSGATGPGSVSLGATIEASSGGASWTSGQPGSISGSNAYGSGYNIEQATTGLTGPTNSVLDLYQLNSATRPNTTPGTYLGDFSLNSSGVLTFTTAVAPEPSTFGMLGLSLAFMVVLVARRYKVNSTL